MDFESSSRSMNALYTLEIDNILVFGKDSTIYETPNPQVLKITVIHLLSGRKFEMITDYVTFAYQVSPMLHEHVLQLGGEGQRTQNNACFNPSYSPSVNGGKAVKFIRMDKDILNH